MRKVKDKKYRKVTVLLTRYSDLFSNFLYIISNRGYTHVSISLDEEEEYFYSFNIKGFCIEKPKKIFPKSRKVGSMSISLQVPEKIYERLKQYVDCVMENRDHYYYSKLGVVLCLLRIPHKFNHHYFCSQFVAEILADSGTAKFKKCSSLYLPHQLISELQKLPYRKKILFNAI